MKMRCENTNLFLHRPLPLKFSLEILLKKTHILRCLMFAGIVLLMHNWDCHALEVSSEEYEIIKQFETLSDSDPVAAEKYLHESLQTKRTVPLLYQAALVEVNKNRIEKAVDYFSEILSIDDQFPGAYKNRGAALCNE